MTARRIAAGLLAAVSIASGAAVPASAGPATPGSGARGRYIAVFQKQADLKAASAVAERNARRIAVLKAKTDVMSVQGPVRSLLEDWRRQGFVSRIRPLWMVNAIAFEGTSAAAEILRGRSEIQMVRDDHQIFLEKPAGSENKPPVGTVEWNVDLVRAPAAWTAGVSGGGVVVATVDTGVDTTHPSLAGDYRGQCSGSDACSWYDAINNRTTPYDDHGHGTHVMGTITGGDGFGPFATDTGVAPAAKFIAAKAFNESGWGLVSDILLSTQWIQAPGPNPLEGPGDPLKAPDVVNNSWAFGKCVTIYSTLMLESWRAAGIVPVFAIGNSGPFPHSAESPGELPGALGIGATKLERVVDEQGQPQDQEDVYFNSSRGPGCVNMATKPDLTAPGVSIRSAAPGGGYVTSTGTSMSAPHVAGAAALAIQASGGSGVLSLALLEQAIRQSAVDLNGGGPDDDLGYGRLDAKGAADSAAALATQTGQLTGTVLQTGCRPTQGALVRATNVGNASDVRLVFAGTGGQFAFLNIKGTFDVDLVTAFGYTGSPATRATVPNGGTGVANVSPSALPCGAIAGVATRGVSGEPVAGAEVRLKDVPIDPVSTDALGAYTFTSVPEGTYTVTLAGDRCGDVASRTREVTVTGTATATQNFSAGVRVDAGGYWCTETLGSWVPGTEVLDLAGDDRSLPVQMPFAFPLYGTSSSVAYVSTNGFVRFDAASDEYANGSIPSAGTPDLAVYPFWDDLVVQPGAQVLTSSTANRFVIEWRDVSFALAPDQRVTFAAILHRNGDVEFQYLSATGTVSRGSSATIGIENASSSIAFEYSLNDGAAIPGTGVLITRAANVGLLTGVVRDGALNPIQGASVVATAAGAGRQARTDAAGRFKMWLSSATYSVSATMFGYASASSTDLVAPSATVSRTYTLAALPAFPLAGTVTDASTGAPLAGIEVRTNVAEVAAVKTGPTGAYAFTLPAGSYTLTAAPSGGCQVSQSASVSHAGPSTTRDFALVVKRDAFPFTCRELEDGAEPLWADETPLELEGDDQAHAGVDLPFTFPYYGTDVKKIFVSTNGFIRFDEPSAQRDNRSLPSTGHPNNAIYPFWDDLVVDHQAAIIQKRTPTAFGIEWRDVLFYDAPHVRVTFSAILFANGDIEFRYLGGGGALARGASATIGVENPAGTQALQYSKDSAVLGSRTRILFHPETHPVTGTVTEAVIATPLKGATVRATGPATVTAGTDAEGAYRLLLREGTYTLTASKFGYASQSIPHVVTAPAVRDFALNPDGGFKIFGDVTDSGSPGFALSGVLVKTDDPDAPTARTAGPGPNKGRYEIVVSPGTYTVTALGRCRGSASQTVTVTTTNVRADLAIGVVADADYRCEDDEPTQWQSGLVPLVVDGARGDDASILVPLPFEFPVYGERSRLAYVSTNGAISFQKPGSTEQPPAASNPCHTTRSCLPDASGPNAALYPFWDDLIMDDLSQILVGASSGAEGFVIEWRYARYAGDSSWVNPAQRITFQAILYPNGVVDYQYRTIVAGPSTSRPVIGIENGTGSAGLQYPLATPLDTRVRFCPAAVCPL